MSTDQPTLDEFGDDVRERTPEPAWDPGQEPRRCQNCGSHVTPEYRRVQGDGEGVVHACPNCASGAELINGAAAGKDGDPKENIPTAQPARTQASSKRWK